MFDTVAKSPVVPQKLLIVRLDVIGDYVLFHNFLELIRDSDQFRSYHITLCGNELWKDIAVEFDNRFVDEFIWLNKHQFLYDPAYRKNVLKNIASRGFEVAVCPNASRDFLLGDAIIRASHASERIGSCASKSIDNWVFSRIGSVFYTRLIDNRKPHFEFDKNSLFFEQLLGERIKLDLPYFDVQRSREKSILIIPGAGEPSRQWNVDYFIELAKALLASKQYKIVIAGGKADKQIADAIISRVDGEIRDLTGKTTLPELIRLMASSALVVAHDSGGLHLAAATRTNVIGLMTGKHYMRFGPYPGAPANMKLIFPEPEEYYQKLFEKYGPAYFEDVIWDINKIAPKVVIEQSKKLLHDFPPDR